MKRFGALLLFGLFAIWRADGQPPAAPAPAPGSASPVVETIVCFRHGEKPPGGLGQLNCRGLNRALALPKVLLPKFGKPQFVFAPNPSQRADGFDYLRPLATVEPVAIQCGLPVDTRFGFLEIRALESELEKPAYQNATVYMSWEHVLLAEFAKEVVTLHGGDPSTVPNWAVDDFDTIYVLKITTTRGRRAVSFSTDHEGLNSLSDDCP
jgi:hypothetical protein